MKNIYQLLIVVVIIIFLVIFKDWVRTKIIVSLGGYTEQTTTITVDSTFIKGKVDTLAIFNNYVATNGIILNPKPIIKYKYKYLNPSIKEEVVIDSVKTFTVKVKDSIIDGNINIANAFNGDLVNAYIKYKPLVPKLLIRVDTFKVVKTVDNFLSKERSKFGFGLGTDSQLTNLDLLGSFTTKNGWQIIYEYSNPIKDFNVNVPQLNFENLTFPRSGVHSIKLLKNF